MQATLLVEILTEELPPKSLRGLSAAFLQSLSKALTGARLVGEGTGRALATPRRLAVLIPDVAAQAQDRESELTGPSTKAPEQAVAGFARKAGIAVNRLERRNTPKGEVYIARVYIKGALLSEVLPAMVEEALKSLPIPKMMRWGSGEAQFVRPVHGLVLLHGERVLPGTVLGIPAGRDSAGHRFMGTAKISLKSADEYEKRL